MTNFNKQSSRQNKLINLIEVYKHELELMRIYFNDGNYKKVISIYESTLKKEPDLKVDTSMIGFAYMMLNENEQSQKFTDTIKNVFSITSQSVYELSLLISAQARFNLNKLNEALQITNKYSGHISSNVDAEGLFIEANSHIRNNTPNKAIHLYYEIIKLPEGLISPKYFFRAYTKIAEMMMTDSADDGEESIYYLTKAFQYFDIEFLGTPAFINAIQFYQKLSSLPVAKSLEKQLEKLDQMYDKKLQKYFHSIFINDTYSQNEEFIEPGFTLQSMLQSIVFNTEAEANEIYNSLKELILEEQPKFAYINN